MKKLVLIFLITPCVAPWVTAQSNLPDKLTLKDIFHEPFIPGTRPNFSHFSPDDDLVYFNWSDSATSNTDLFQVDLKGKNVEKAPDGIQRFFKLSPDRKKVVYTEKGDLVLADTNFENARTIVASKDFDYDAEWKKDSRQIAYIQNGNAWISGVDDAFVKQVTDKKEDEPGYNVVGWAGENHLVLRQSDNSDYKEYYFPEYHGKYVDPGSTRRGISTAIVSIADLESGDIREVFRRKGWLRTELSADGDLMALDWTDASMKKREVMVYDISNDTTITVFDDSTEGWIYDRDIEFAPSGNKLMIHSEKDGWNHIYTINPDGSHLQQHTSGEYEVHWAEWLDQNTLVIATSERDPGEIQVYKLDLKSNRQTQLTKDEGYRRSFDLSHNKRYLVYSKTYFNEPFDLYLIDLKRPKGEVRLTNSVPDSFHEYDWQQEDYVRFTGRDGETRLSASILKPLELNPEGNPVVVFVHGAGSLQNVYKGWSNNYWREYLFNQYLTAKGYYVLEVDYRHSTGYGQKFREDVTNWMGKYETQDIQDGLRYLAGNYEQVDTSRVGIYGGSYGGFMALYAVSAAPESFDAAAGLRSVTNWENYYYTNPWYTQPRLGTPEADSIHYARSSPVTYADSLTKPVLLLHGLIDNNVGFQDVAHYIERLVQSGNEDFEMMMYPSERHSFRDEDAWYDEYRRIFEFFEEKLKKE